MADREAVRQASPLEEVIPRLVGDSLHGKSGEPTVRCPFHEDRRPSLRMNIQKQVWRCDPCDIGGDVFAFVRQFNKCGFPEALRFLAERCDTPDTETSPTQWRSSSPSGSWIYHRPDGAEVFKVERFEDGGGKKRFLQSAPDGRGGWICQRGCMDGVERWLYRVDHLGGQDTVCLVEGEKVADAMCALGIPTTTMPGGAGKWHTSDPTRSPIGLDGYAAQFVAAGNTNVAIFPDNDDPGRRHAQDAARACHAAGLRVKVVTLPGLPPAGDLVDFLKAGGTKADVYEAIRDALRYEPGAPVGDTQAGSPGATPSHPDESPDSPPLDCEALLVEHKLWALDEHIDRAVLDGRLRQLVVALRGSDRLRVALVRDALITELRTAKIRAAAAIVDAALTIKVTAPDSRQGAPLLLADVDLWPEPVDGSAVLDDVVRTITRFIVLPTHGAVALALWILHTYVMGAWWLSPLAVVTSPTRRCGKTALLMVVSELVHCALAASNISPAALFRAVEKFQPTLLLDEGETWLKANEELRGIVNAGHTRPTAMVIRTVGDDHEPATFSTWCPKFIALIGTLSDTIMDRAIVIEMRRKTAEERVERLRLDHLPDICGPLCRQMARWALDHADGLATCDPEVPTGLHDRAVDNWRPLLALSDSLGEEWSTRARAAARALAGVEQEDTLAVQLLWDIKEVFDDEVMSSADIVTALIALDGRPWATYSRQDKPLTTNSMARLLSRFHIRPSGNLRVGDKVRKGYCRAAFVDSWARYPLTTATRNKPNKDGPQLDKPNRYTDPPVVVAENGISSMNTGGCYGVAVETEGPAADEELL